MVGNRDSPAFSPKVSGDQFERQPACACSLARLDQRDAQRQNEVRPRLRYVVAHIRDSWEATEEGSTVTFDFHTGAGEAGLWFWQTKDPAFGAIECHVDNDERPENLRWVDAYASWKDGATFEWSRSLWTGLAGGKHTMTCELLRAHAGQPDFENRQTGARDVPHIGHHHQMNRRGWGYLQSRIAELKRRDARLQNVQPPRNDQAIKSRFI
jgi:hypothetical protein